MARQHAAAAALFAVLTVALTWPLARTLGSAVAWPGDPFINIWILDWDWWATFHRPLSLFQANTFYPARDSLAYSENLYGIALLLFPLRVLGVPPIAAYNVAMLLGYAFSGFGAYLLGRSVTTSWWAGVAGGIFYAFLPFRMTHAAHVQHVWGGWLPVLLLALLHYRARPSWGRAAMFGGAFLMNGLTNIHWLLFGTVAIAVTMLGVIPSAARNPRPTAPGDSAPSTRLGMTRAILPIAACTLAAALLLTPFLLPYARAAREYHMTRSWREVKSFSAVPSDWLRANPTLRWYHGLADERVDPERWLFPGALGIALSLAALATRDRRPLAIGLTWIVLGVAGSLGSHLFFHRFLFGYVPGFRAIRVPARWANVAYVGMALLIALAVRALSRDRRWVGPLIAGALLVELCSAPILWYMAVPAAPPVYQWMRDAKPVAVLELPIGMNDDYSYMLRATEHHRPIVNGISGFTPPEVQRIATLAQTKSDALVPELRRAGVSHIAVHGDAVDDATRQWLRRELAAERLAFVKRFDGGVNGDWLFATSGGGPNLTPQLEAFLGGQPTYNGETFGFLDLPLAGQRIGGAAYFSGFAISPYGIRSVALLFANGRVRTAPFLFDDAALRRRFPWYDATTRPRFIREIRRRPPGVRERTDVQVEIIDGRGKRTMLEDRFFRWPSGD